MNRPKLVIALVFALVFALAASALAGPAIEPALEALRLALNGNDFDRLEPHLHPDFVFSGYGGAMGVSILRQVVAQYPREIERLEVVESLEEPGLHRVEVRLHLDGGEVETHQIHLAEDLRLLRADVVQIQLAAHPAASPERPRPQAAAEDVPARTELPFELADRLVVVEAEVDGVRGPFLFDSGAPGALTLDASRFPRLAAGGARAERAPHGVNGSVEGATVAEVERLRLGSIELTGVEAALWDLESLAQRSGVEGLLGLIGYELLEPFLVELDYPGRRVTLHRLDAAGRPVARLDSEPAHRVEVEMLYHLPVVEVSVGGEKLRLGIDTGAEGGMLMTRWEEPLAAYYRTAGTSELSGADGRVVTGSEVVFEELAVGGLPYGPMTLRFNDLQFGHEVEIDGLLGYDLLSRRRTALNLRAGELLVW